MVYLGCFFFLFGFIIDITLDFRDSANHPPLAKMNINDIRRDYIGKSITAIPSPNFIINKSKFAGNCASMRSNIKALEEKTNIRLKFRPHMKTHKTIEGLLLQLDNGKSSKSVLVSTLAEAEYILSDSRINTVVNEICYTLPVTQNAMFMNRLKKVADQVKLVLFIDNIEQLQYLKNNALLNSQKWNVFLKIDVGTQRAGIQHDNEDYLKEVFQKLALFSKSFDLYGIYAHAGHSYDCKDREAVSNVLIEELKSVIEVAEFQSKQNSFDKKLVLSIGGTPTIKAIEDGHIDFLKLLLSVDKEKFELELHCGNYCMLDLQQASTKVSKESDIAGYVLSSVVSNYPLRNESLCNAGVLALTRETSSYKGHGIVFEIEEFLNLKDSFEILPNQCCINRISQEHGIIKDKLLKIGQGLVIIPQHACIVAARYPFYVITDENYKVTDIWVPCKGW